MRHLSLLAVLALGLAAAPLSAQGSDNKGKFYFKKNCKTCHTADKGKEITPLSRTQAQWKKFFQAGKHKQDPLSKFSAADQLVDIQTFLVNHASDSPAPETCGSN